MGIWGISVTEGSDLSAFASVDTIRNWQTVNYASEFYIRGSPNVGHLRRLRAPSPRSGGGEIHCLLA